MADSKITGLAADASPTGDDLLVTVNDSGGTPDNKKVTVDNLDTYLAGTTKTITGVKTFGTPGGTVGRLKLAGATSGSITLDAPLVAGTTNVNTLPPATTVLVGDDYAQTLSNKTLTAPVINTATIGTSLVPTSNDGAPLGNTTNQFSDLFLAEGGVINWDNGDATITQANNILTVAGASLTLAAGTSTEPSLKLSGTTKMTTPSDGAIEMDATNMYATTDAGNRGYIPIRHYIRAAVARTLPNDTNLNAIFNDPANGTLTLETGVYKFEIMVRVSAMSATSGNALINIDGAGTATVGSYLWFATAADNSALATPVGWESSMIATAATAASAATAGVGTIMGLYGTGTFDVTVAGTIIPSIDQVTAAAASVAAGSYFMCERIGATGSGTTEVGQWT